MKKLLLILFLIGSWSGIAQAQVISPYKQEIDNLFPSEQYKQFILLVSPDLKERLTSVKNIERPAASVNNQLNSAGRDTSIVNYTENAAFGDSIWAPVSFIYNITETGDNDFRITERQSYNFSPDLLNEYYLTQKSFQYFTAANADSNMVYYYTKGNDEPTSGFKYKYTAHPEGGMDRETIYENYNSGIGWQPNQKLQYFSETYQLNGFEGKMDTLSKTFRYNLESETYYLEQLSRTRNYLVHGYSLSEMISYYAPESIMSWTYSYTHYEDDKMIYMLTKSAGWDGEVLVSQDSLHVNYVSDLQAIASSFSWSDSLYELSNYYHNFYSEIAGQTKVDSVLYYNIIRNENEEKVPGDLEFKTNFKYDDTGRQIETTTYYNIDGELILYSKIIDEYGKFGVMLKETYAYSAANEELYKSEQVINKYDSVGRSILNKNFNFSAAGDTTGGSIHETYTIDEHGYTGYGTYYWNNTLKKMELSNYSITSYRDDSGQGISQQHYYYPGSTSKSRRSVNAFGNNVFVFNDGPKEIAEGDTVIFYISARYLDLSIPEISIEDLPAGATFNPENRRFYWVVNEEVNHTMKVTATKGGSSHTVYVEFRPVVDKDWSITDTEPANTVLEFQLSQNYPNPFNPVTQISYQLPNPGNASLKIYDMLGREVVTLVSGPVAAGTHTIHFDASLLSSGMYIYRLRAGSFIQTKKMILIK